MERWTRLTVLAGALALPAAAGGAPGGASARMTVSVQVVRPAVVSARTLATAAPVIDPSGAPIPVVIRWEQPPAEVPGVRWVTVLTDGAPSAAQPGPSAPPGS